MLKLFLRTLSQFKQSGFRGQILLESLKNPVIVNGHTRVAALKSLGYTELADEHIAYASDLSEEEIKALRLADNRVAQIATWNKTLLRNEVKSLKNFNMKNFGFDFKSKNMLKGFTRRETDKYYNTHLIDASDCTVKYGMPILRAIDYKPKDLIGINYAKTSK